MDKSRPSREHNLVEWARPILNQGKKLVRILDPRIEGQYSSKVLMKVANLTYQCLSQNPKGRPLMTQVIEILEPLVTEGEETVVQNVTLYQVPKENEQINGRSKSEPPKECDLYDPSSDTLMIERSTSQV